MKKRSGAIIGLLISILLVFQVSATEMDWSKPVLIEVPDIPQLPSGMSNLKLRGMTTVKIEIDNMGLVSNSQTVASTGSEKLDRFIQAWIKDWKYLPRLQDDRPVSGFSMVVINFDLQNQSFHAPSPVTEAIQIPDVLVNVLVQRDRVDSGSENSIVDGSGNHMAGSMIVL